MVSQTGADIIRKTALVTGGSRGIGRGIAFVLAERGFDLVISHWQDEVNAKETSELIRHTFGRSCEVFEGNLAEENEPVKLAEQAIHVMGRIDVLVNNAGITLFKAIDKIDILHTNRLLHLNFRAPVLLMQAISQHMIEQGIQGNIVNITSTRAERAYAQDAVYGGVKAALARAAASAAIDLSPHGIRVNCIGPGAIDTRDGSLEPLHVFNPGVPLNRSGTPKDIGRAVAWLVSPEASYMTGTTLRVDGGLILPGTPH